MPPSRSKPARQEPEPPFPPGDFMPPSTRGISRARHGYRTAPPLTHGEESAEGAEIVREIAGTDGVLLASALRDLMLLIDLAARAPAAAIQVAPGDWRENQVRRVRDMDVAGPLVVLAINREPATADLPRVLYACRRIAAWAEERGAPATRLAFTQACALADPTDTESALTVARLARELGQHARAESWFRHTIKLSRGRDWEPYVWAYVGLGVLYIRSGNLPAARAMMDRALRTAEHKRLRHLAGVAHHHLFHFAAETRQIRSAYHHARRALEAYRGGHAALPGLASDVGRFWLTLGEPGRALTLFEQAQVVIADTNVRAMVTANVARAAAALGGVERYERARRDALELVASAQGRARIGETYASLAYADLAMGEWPRAEAMACAALEIAAAAGEAEVRMIAESQIEAARAGRAASDHSEAIEGPVLAREAERLGVDLAHALTLPAPLA